jgi:TolB-like protein/DNA-binding winged helix-turn-helix (wHTH) protein/Tfp pilus assembly protein PilF
MPEGKHFYEFGPFRLDPAERSLLRDGKAVPLTPKAFELLVLLVENRGHLLKKDELIERVWPNTFVEEANLAQNVSALRKVLDDKNGGAQYIETVPKGGYRFTATVGDHTLPAGVESPAAEPPSPRPATRVALPYVLAFLATAAVAVTLMLAFQRGLLHRRSSGAASVPRIQSLAVLPLENLSGDPSQDYFADGMTDALITSLGQISSLRVISRTSVMQYRGVHKPLPQIARELNVDAVVEGTVVRSSGQVRIAAELIQASTDKHLWSQSYQRDLKDVLGLQHEIASAIAKQIRMTLTPGEQIQAGTEQSVNFEAYESYLRGEYFVNRFTPDSLRKAADYFQRAIEKDPNYPAAYIKLAACYQIPAEMGAMPPKVAYPKSKLLIAKALELDPQFAAAHAARGWALLDYDLDFAAAGAEFQRAVELNPNGAEGHLGLGNYYAAMGRMQESVQEAQRARELTPLDLIVNINLCAKLYFTRRYDEALAQCKANQDLDPGSPNALDQLGAVYAAKGMDSEAALAFLRSHELGGASPAMIAALKTGERDSGLRGFWRTWLHFQRANIAAGTEDPMITAVAYAYVGDTDKALTWLEKAFKARRAWIIYLGVDPAFDSLRSDPRFASLLKRIGLPQSQTRN